MVFLFSQSDKGEKLINVEVAKQRNGRTGDVTLVFLKPHLRFENYTGDVAPQ